MQYRLTGKDRLVALRIVAIYALVSSLWIYSSDTLLGALVRDPDALVRYSVLKGLAFITATVCLLYYLIARYTRQRLGAEEELKRLNELLELRVAERTRKLQKSEERFRALVEASSDAVYRMSPDWTKLRELHGRDFLSDTETPISSWLQKYIHPEDQSQIMAAINEAIGSRGTFELEHRFLRVDGTVGWTFSRAVPMLDENGEITEWFGAASDVTKRREAEESLRQTYQELEQKTAEQLRGVEELRQKDMLLIQQSRMAAMGEMLVNIAHHWRQPLNVVGLKMQQLALAYEFGEFSKELLDSKVAEAMETLQHLSKTIDQFQAITAQDREKSPFSVCKVISDVLLLTREGFNAAGVGVEAQCNGEPQINGYANQFAQVLLNILMNASEAFQEKGAADARILLRSWVEGSKAIVTITDNAGGIREEILDRIFDAYFTTKEQGKGTGVGLFMAKTLVEKKMGGRLTVRNVEGGAEFRIEV